MELSASKKGLLYMWQGYSGDISLQTFPAFVTRQIQRVALGGEHSLFLTSDLEVFSCGSNSHGQLGLGSLDVKESQHPQLIASLSGNAVVDVACGKRHSGAVCHNGEVFCWGDSSSGQCGVDMSPVVSPFHVEIFTNGDVCEHGIRSADRSVCMKKLACGAEHTIALSHDSNIWVWGTGIQLGLGEVTHTTTPQQLSSIVGRSVVDICCGDTHTMVLVEKTEKDSSAYVRPKQTPIVAKIQKHFPSQCAACKKEIYTYTETGDTCIIDEAHDCRDSMRLSLESSCGSISAEPSFSDCSVAPSNNSLLQCQKTITDSVASSNQNLSECQKCAMDSVALSNQNLSEYQKCATESIAPSNQNLSKCQKSAIDSVSLSKCKKDSSEVNINPSCENSDVKFIDSRNLHSKDNIPHSDRVPVDSKHSGTPDERDNSNLLTSESLSSVDSLRRDNQNKPENLNVSDSDKVLDSRHSESPDKRENLPISERVSSLESPKHGNQTEEENLNVSVSDSLLSVDSQHFCSEDKQANQSVCEDEQANQSVCMDTSCIGDYKIHNESVCMDTSCIGDYKIHNESLSELDHVDLITHKVFLDPLSGLSVHPDSDKSDNVDDTHISENDAVKDTTEIGAAVSLGSINKSDTVDDTHISENDVLKVTAEIGAAVPLESKDIQISDTKNKNVLNVTAEIAGIVPLESKDKCDQIEDAQITECDIKDVPKVTAEIAGIVPLESMVKKTDENLQECRDVISEGELREVLCISVKAEDRKELNTESKTPAAAVAEARDEVVWRRMVSLEAELTNQKGDSDNTEGLETATYLEGEAEGETSLNATFQSTLQSFLPYSTAMLQTMKSMTSQTLSNIQMSVSYVTKQTAGLAFTSDTDTVDTSSPLTSMTTSMDSLHANSPLTTSLDSLPDGAQDTSFTEGRVIKENRSGTWSPMKENSPVKDPSPDESRVSKKSQSLRTVWAKQEQLERISSPSASHQGEEHHISPGRSHRGHPISTVTEVWVWGQNKKCQLGVGDGIDRPRPSCIKMFSSRSVVKLVAGSTHSLALTAVGQVYSWGSNSYGQLGHTETALSPFRIKFMKGSHIWDIAAGKNQSLFLADSGGIKPHVFFCGKQPTKDLYSTVVKTTVPIQLPPLKKAGWLRQVSAGGDNCACLLDNSSTMVKILYEFAASERYFFHNLNKIEIFFLKPLMKSTFFTSLDVFPYKSCVHELVTANIFLTHHVCKLLTELSFAIRDGLDVCDVSHFYNYNHHIDMFRKYTQRLADFIAIGGFKYVSRVGGSFFDKITDLFRQLLDDQVDPGNHAANFRLAMLQPVLRVKECAKLTTKLSENAQQGSTSACLLKKVALNWESLKMTTANELAHADRTCAFWETASPKVADMLRIPNRRLLRESKSHPLVFPTSGRFSSSMFLLFNDIFVHSQNSVVQVFSVETMWVETPESDIAAQTGLVVTTPEEILDLIAASPAEKAEWLMALNSAINKVLSMQKSSSSSLMSERHSSHERLTPPLIRHASYTFVKSGPYKDATYTGSWLNGKLHGYGELKWQDGRKHIGKFKQGLQHGHGILSIPKGGNCEETHEGNWKDGKLNGHATIRYVNGDNYEGCFKDGQRFGHGVYKQGQHMSSIASIFIGEWLQDKRCGYGVQDDILKGEKYMGMWQDDCRHGKGIVVTLDGMYFEGNFVHNKLSGGGLMLTDDNSCYEGEFQDITQLQGKGTLILPTGDKIEGHFSGSWNEGLKINGTFIKNVESPEKRSHLSLDTKSRFYSKLSVPADKKWEDIFRHCSLLLGYGGLGKADTAKAWEAVAIMITAGRETVKELAKSSPNKARQQLLNLENLEIIPPHNSGNLTIEEFSQISCYLNKAFDSTFHPFGKLMDNLVDVFRAAYIGVGAHPRLLFHAVEEVHSYIRRIYAIIRLLFPDLPANGGPIFIYPARSQQRGIPCSTEEAERFFQHPTQTMESQEISEVVTQAGILYPLLLPKIYPPLFDLYALFNDKQDELYWERIMKLNRQGDVALMAYLGVEQKFWLLDEDLIYDKSQKFSQIREECYAAAVEMLQQIGTAFSPIDKLKVLEETFMQITKTVQASLKEEHVWCLDDLFPIFQFVVVRAQIRHLGAEIHLIHDLMENHMQYGELGVIATTLNACYFQIQTEKLTLH